MLTQSILRRPCLAPYVRSLDTSCLEHEAWLDGDPPQPNLTEEECFTMEVNPDLEILLRAVETVKIPQGTMDQGEWRTFHQQWQDTLRVDPSNIDAHIAILLASLPNLRTFIVHTMEKSSKDLMLEVLRRFAGRKDLSGARPILGFLAHLHSFFYNELILATEIPTIPTLTHFCGNNLDISDLEQDRPESHETAPSLVYLQLNECCAGADDLETKLKRFTHLQALSRARLRVELSPIFDIFRTGACVRALEPICDGLKCLWLSYTDYSDIASEIEPIEGFVRPVNLVEFHALTSLHIIPRYLVGVSRGNRRWRMTLLPGWSMLLSQCTRGSQIPSRYCTSWHRDPG